MLGSPGYSLSASSKLSECLTEGHFWLAVPCNLLLVDISDIQRHIADFALALEQGCFVQELIYLASLERVQENRLVSTVVEQDPDRKGGAEMGPTELRDGNMARRIHCRQSNDLLIWEPTLLLQYEMLLINRDPVDQNQVFSGKEWSALECEQRGWSLTHAVIRSPYRTRNSCATDVYRTCFLHGDDWSCRQGL